MLSDYVFDVRVQKQLEQDSCLADLNGFTNWLTDRDYAKATIRSYILAAAGFTAWARANDCSGAAMLQPAGLVAYRGHLSTLHERKRAYDVNNAYCGARRFVLFLRECAGSGFQRR